MKKDNYISHIDPKWSDKTKERLSKLADIIENVDPKRFNMGAYLLLSVKRDERGYISSYEELTQYSKIKHECDSVGCAVGIAALHYKELGIRRPWLSVQDFKGNEIRHLDWDRLRGFLVGNDVNAYDYLFNAIWEERDNTTSGTANRIRYCVEHGIPSNYYGQLYSGHPLSYKLEGQNND